MDPATALADLTEISSQVEAAVVLESDGSLAASTFPSEERAQRLARAALDLLAAATELRPGQLTQLEVALREGGVYVVRENGRLIAATVAPGSPAGLVLYDLRSCLRSIDEPKPQQPRRAPKKSTADA